MPTRRPAARVLFDESHGESWTIRPEVARAIQPAHPEDSSYALAAQALARRDVAVTAHVQGPLDAAALAAADVLVLAHPSDPRWERTVPGAAGPVLGDAELEAIETFVRAGGGLLVLGEEEQEKYANNLNALVTRFGITIESDAVSDYEHHDGAPHWVLADLDHTVAGGVDALANVGSACFYRAGRLALRDGARALARSSGMASAPRAPLLAAAQVGAGRVVVAADSDLFGDDCIGLHDHETLWCNLVLWAGAAAFARPAPRRRSPAHEDPHWAQLRGAVDRVRLAQQRDGSIELARHDRTWLDAELQTICAAARALGEHFPHQREYIDAVVCDCQAWAREGFGRPDFTASLAVFRPELHRRDGIEHLVLFPMYKQNGSRDQVLEALIVRVPWPDWLAELEATRYDNPKFVPVTLVDHTAGYDSECAVLFPETVAVADRRSNNFGAIFCDREAERFRRMTRAAATMLSLNLPPDAAALVASEAISEQAFALWDLIHDRAHSRGNLPFDPFMIRQRMPYWMYALEELRCDLTAYAEAAALERDGFGFASNVRHAILLDRMLRFPITGQRVRNYDGLAGQLLFAFLHRSGRLHWTDGRLTIDWIAAGEGVLELRALVDELYRSGIDRSRLQHWCAAHDLVAAHVPPTTASAWRASRHAFSDDEDPRRYIDLVHDDEFPLSIFYASLRGKLGDALRRPLRAAA
ncbi:MAG: hypothetical protein QOE11_1290 [Solirubrobacteraceae bacterium]|jgi:hypothetical protein|nr:hypothetical protein [Solirubrobacteraceae bacterium]